jgi:hypothetical protein
VRVTCGIIALLWLAFLGLPAGHAQTPAADVQAACEARQRQLLQALHAYRVEHHGLLPERMSQLYYEAYVSGLSAFTCPGVASALTDRTQIDTLGGYLLLAKSWPAAGRVPILGDRSPSGHGGQVCTTCSDGSVQWQAALAAPAVSPAPAATPPAGAGAPFTGLIVDCRGKGVARGMWPKLVSVPGDLVWDATTTASAEAALERGLVCYHASVEEARRCERAGTNPLVVAAVGASGPSKPLPIYPVVSAGDASIIQAEDARGRFLAALNVCLVVD